MLGGRNSFDVAYFWEVTPSVSPYRVLVVRLLLMACARFGVIPRCVEIVCSDDSVSNCRSLADNLLRIDVDIWMSPWPVLANLVVAALP